MLESDYVIHLSLDTPTQKEENDSRDSNKFQQDVKQTQTTYYLYNSNIL